LTRGGDFDLLAGLDVIVADPLVGEKNHRSPAGGEIQNGQVRVFLGAKRHGDVVSDVVGILQGHSENFSAFYSMLLRNAAA
jgi:hypothetical protein